MGKNEGAKKSFGDLERLHLWMNPKLPSAVFKGPSINYVTLKRERERALYTYMVILGDIKG